MSHSNLLTVKLFKHFVIGSATGSTVGLVLGVLNFSFSQTALVCALIGGISFGIAESISIIGKTWWQNSLLWGITMGILLTVLTRLLLPSIGLNVIGALAVCITYSLGVNWFERKS